MLSIHEGLYHHALHTVVRQSQLYVHMYVEQYATILNNNHIFIRQVQRPVQNLALFTSRARHLLTNVR